ncbi:hypothetical protein F4823DRAFT_569565 [Ustulina deusta]|nr:hypothetical protein F4823DRAFT_569565 [Ustulina deusta]
MAEAQVVDRVYRIGQTRDVQITRYCVNDSIEESLSSSDHGPGEKEEEALNEGRWEVADCPVKIICFGDMEGLIRIEINILAQLFL